MEGWRRAFKQLIGFALISLAAPAFAETLTVSVDIPDRYQRAASEKCQIDEGTRAIFIIRFTPALDRYLHIGYRLLIDNKAVEEGASVTNPKGSQLDSDRFVWDTENSGHEPDGVHEYTLELLAANTEMHPYVVGTPRSRTITVCDNDEPPPPPPPPPVVAFATASSEVSEGAGTKNVAVTVDPAPQSEITVSYSVAGTAKAGSDYSLSGTAGTVRVAPGASRVNIPITIIDDKIEDSGETVVLTLTGGADYTVGNLSRHTLTITNDDASPEATFAAAGSTAEEGAGTHDIRIDLSPPPAAGITIGYGVAGSAASGSDYTSLSGTVTVRAGTSSVTLPVTIADDDEVESSETVVLTLAGGAGYTVGSARRHTVTITDNDTPLRPPPPRPSSPSPPPPEATFAAASSTAEEGAGTHDIRIDLNPLPAAEITIGYEVSGSAASGSDYTSLSGSVTVQAGASSVTLPVTIADDDEVESSETVVLTLTGGAGYTVGSAGRHTLTITDNDTPPPPPTTPAPPPPPEATFAAASSTAEEGAGTHDIRIELSPPPAAGITIGYGVAGSAASGSDYTSLSGTVTVQAGASSGSLAVTIADDDEVESSETVVLTLAGGTGYTVGSVGRHTVTITDNDTPPPAPEATFAAASSTVDEGAGTHGIRIELSPPPAAGITIGYGVAGSAASGSDYPSLSGTVTVAAGTSSVSLAVTIADDDEVESSETVVLTLTGGAGYTVGSVGRHTVTITDNDPPPPPTPPEATVSISDAAAEEGQQVTFTVRSEPAASSPITLSWTVADGSAVAGEDYSESAGGTVTISAGAGTATFQVATTDDRIDEGDETFTVTLTDDPPAGVGFASNTATGTIRDNDTAGIALSDQTIWISDLGGSAHYAVRLESEPEAPVTIAMASDNLGVAGVSPQRLVFSRFDWNMAKTVTVTGAGIGEALVVHQASSVDGTYAGLQAKVRIRVDDDLVEVAGPWLARFARTSAGNVLDGITNRRTALRAPGFEGAVAGRPIEFATRTDDVLAISGERLPGGEFQPLSAGEVLPATAFALNSEQAAGGGTLALWGRGAWSRFDGSDEALTLEGEVASGMLGIDGTVGAWLLGVALSHNAGTGGYQRASGRDGDVQASLTIVAPYAVGHVSDRLTVYGALGYGGGALTVEPLGWQAQPTRTGFAMAAAGTRVDIVAAARGAGFGLTATTDAMLMRANAQAAGDALPAFDADVSQLRVGMTGSWRQELAAFGAVQPRLEIGARHDGGHAETGVGLEIGGGVMWSVPALGLGVSAESRALIAHVDDRLSDWGASAALSWDPAPASAVGPALSLRHDWGGASSDGLGALASAARFGSLAESEAGEKLLTAEAVWGIALADAGLISAPYVGFEGTGSARDYTLGWRITHAASATSDLSLGVSATRREIEGRIADHLFGVELNSRW